MNVIGVGWTLLKAIAHPGGVAVERGWSVSEGILVAAVTRCWTEVMCRANRALDRLCVACGL